MMSNMTNHFNYEPNTDPDTRLIKHTGRSERYLVSFPPAGTNPDESKNALYGEYLRPYGNNLPLAILVHGLGDRSVIPMKLLARELADQGIASFILYLITHSSRTLPVDRPLSDDEWFENYRTSVIDVRHVLDWMETREEVAKGKAGIVGLSFGGFISAIAMGIDHRINSGVLIISGGNLEKIGMRSRVLSRKWDFHRSEAEFATQQQRYHRYLDEVVEKGWEQVAPPERSFLVDAMTYAHYLRNRPLLMINGRWDEIIPKEATLDFWESAGRPPITWFPSGHSSIWLCYPFISWKIKRFFRSSLE
ncbi:MAG: alpha/beta hydrolase [Dehalococcoidales bacterium]|nr:alpha/beta hydrolase [Dehalococcoidales bacterium]